MGLIDFKIILIAIMCAKFGDTASLGNIIIRTIDITTENPTAQNAVGKDKTMSTDKPMFVTDKPISTDSITSDVPPFMCWEVNCNITCGHTETDGRCLMRGVVHVMLRVLLLLLTIVGLTVCALWANHKTRTRIRRKNNNSSNNK